MLQQTQSSRVKEKLPIFLKRFPDFRKLVKASKADVIHAWRGMGYNNRAVRLWELAEKVVYEYRGKLPRDVEKLKELYAVKVS